ncbi:hypothetical protein DXG01_014554 [Tephrocybe rancida]|nr:hypothetical protein DXG01_014554 [Tephrocybe rancida]
MWLLRPKLLHLLDEKRHAEIIQDVQNLIAILGSKDVALDGRHTPALYSRFLSSLLAKHSCAPPVVTSDSPSSESSATQLLIHEQPSSSLAYSWPDIMYDVDTHNPQPSTHGHYTPGEVDMDLSLSHFVRTINQGYPATSDPVPQYVEMSSSPQGLRWDIQGSPAAMHVLYHQCNTVAADFEPEVYLRITYANRPTRASPPAKPSRQLAAVERIAADISRSSTIASVPELSGLSPEEIDLLDAVIERAGPSATAFLSVFKAYNDVLRERGLNPQEVVYYGKLLKLGTMKGKNWGDKWNAVKSQYSHSSGRENNKQYHDRPQPTYHTHRPEVRTRVPPPTEDTFSLHSSVDDDMTSTHSLELSMPNNRPPSRAQTTTSHTSVHLRSDSLLLMPVSASAAAGQSRPWRIEPIEPESEESYAPSTTPPSYFAATTHWQHPNQPKRVHPGSTNLTSAAARQVVANARERKGSVVNEEEAWNRIRMQRDEAEADAFRNYKLLCRCWDVWRQGFRWIVTTDKQIAAARDNLLLRIHLQRWRHINASRCDIHQRITTMSDNRCRRKALSIWRSRLREKEQDKWRQDMRQKMKIIREQREHKLCKDALAKWRQSYRSHISGQHYVERLVYRLYKRWKTRLSTINELELAAGDAFQASQEKIFLRCWDRWRIATDMRVSERVMAERIGLRLMSDSMSVWQKNMHDHRSATEFYQFMLLRSSITSWKASRDRIHALESRALKHVARQDSVLVRAVFRVWKARRQGKTVERLKASNLTYAAWSVWKQQLQQQRRSNDLALAFALRADSSALVAVFHKWQEVHYTHRNAHLVAVQCDSEQLCYKALLAWRMKLRDKLKQAKMARMAASFFSTRRAWRAWHVVMNNRAAEKRLTTFHNHRVHKMFYIWLRRARRQKQLRLAEEIIHDNVTKRTLRDALTVWTNRVIAVKLQELDVAQNFDTALQVTTFRKWQKAYTRHFEMLSLMQSYLLVKREGLARVTRHRRITLKGKEDEIKLSIMAYTWDKWRDRFSDEKLRPMEHVVIIQTQKNTLFRAFGLWHSKTKSLPAIRFHASNLRTQYFESWRQAMPRALQAREAREKDRKTTLSKCLDKWVETYRTKIALKAVAYVGVFVVPKA